MSIYILTSGKQDIYSMDGADRILAMANAFLVISKKKPWTSFEEGHREKIWKGVGGSVTDCMEKMKDKITEPGAFCASLKRSLPKKKKKKK